MTIQKVSNITFKMLTPPLVPRVVDSITKSFATDPFSKSLGLSKSNWEQLATLFVTRASKKDLSIVATNEDDQIVGCIINEDWKEREPPEFHNSLDPKWDPVKSIFSNLHHKYKQEHPNNIKFGEVLHSLYFTSVVPSNRGTGLAYDMWSHTTDLARSHNFQFMCAETATKSGEKLCEKIFGFTPKAHIPFNKFEWKGERVFSKLPLESNAEKLTMWEKKIVSNLY